MVAVTVVLVAFIAMNEAISPDPLAGIPILGVSFVQSKVVPNTPKLLVKVIAEVISPLQID